MDVNEGNLVQVTNWVPYSGIPKNETDQKVGLGARFFGYMAINPEGPLVNWM